MYQGVFLSLFLCCPATKDGMGLRPYHHPCLSQSTYVSIKPGGIPTRMGPSSCDPDLFSPLRETDYSNNPNLSTPSCSICLVACALTLGLTMKCFGQWKDYIMWCKQGFETYVCIGLALLLLLEPCLVYWRMRDHMEQIYTVSFGATLDKSLSVWYLTIDTWTGWAEISRTWLKPELSSWAQPNLPNSGIWARLMVVVLCY